MLVTNIMQLNGHENLDITERVHLKYSKKSQSKKQKPKFMIYDETGRCPLYINVLTRIIKP